MVEINLESGLSESKLEAAVDFYQESHGGQEPLFATGMSNSLTHPFKYAVYIFKCKPRSEDLRDYCSSKLGHVPNWVLSAKNADEMYYVGVTGELDRRLEEHISGGDKASVVTQVYKPTKLTWLDFKRDWQSAKETEIYQANELRDLDGVFVPYEVIK